MSTVPQVYPLWLAEVRDGDVYAGRVVAWQVQEAESPTATPIVAFTAPDGMVLATSAPHGAPLYVADTREEAVAAAQPIPSPGPDDPPRRPGHPPVPADDEDDRRPPEPRTRVQSLRLHTTAEPAPAESPASGPAPSLLTRRHTAG
jgi:hypothetical protein